RDAQSSSWRGVRMRRKSDTYTPGLDLLKRLEPELIIGLKDHDILTDGCENVDRPSRIVRLSTIDLPYPIRKLKGLPSFAVRADIVAPAPVALHEAAGVRVGMPIKVRYHAGVG